MAGQRGIVLFLSFGGKELHYKISPFDITKPQLHPQWTRLGNSSDRRSCQDRPLALRQSANKLADPLRRFEPAAGQNNYSGFRRSDDASVEELAECCRAAG